jgi:hypothetical protein
MSPCTPTSEHSSRVSVQGRLESCVSELNDVLRGVNESGFYVDGMTVALENAVLVLRKAMILVWAEK